MSTLKKPQVELMDKDETCRFFGGHMRPINHATLYRGIKEGRYPYPIKVGANSSRWIKSECEAALARLIEKPRELINISKRWNKRS